MLHGEMLSSSALVYVRHFMRQSPSSTSLATTPTDGTRQPIVLLFLDGRPYQIFVKIAVDASAPAFLMEVDFTAAARQAATQLSSWMSS